MALASWQKLANAFLAIGGMAFVAGCSSTPGRVEMVEIDPDEAAAQAMVLYDTNKDGNLADDELRAVPGILKWKKLYDADGNGSVSEAEIVARLEKWQSDKLGFRALSTKVTLNGRPVGDVEVKLTPESYLGESLKPARGLTNGSGYATLSVKPDDLPEVIKARGIKVQGVYPGTYRISISHPSGKLPSSGPGGELLGDEVARDTVDSAIPIELSTR